MRFVSLPKVRECKGRMGCERGKGGELESDAAWYIPGSDWMKKILPPFFKDFLIGRGLAAMYMVHQPGLSSLAGQEERNVPRSMFHGWGDKVTSI